MQNNSVSNRSKGVAAICPPHLAHVAHMGDQFKGQNDNLISFAPKRSESFQWFNDVMVCITVIAGLVPAI
jgi:hypothetical protein